MRAGVLLWLLLAAPMWAAASPTSDVVHRCASEVADDVHGLDALEKACPALHPALIELGVLPVLSEATRARLTPAQLADATDLVSVRAVRPRPDVQALRPILVAIANRAEAKGWWARLLEWLRHYLGREAPVQVPDWLTRLLNGLDVGPQALGVLLYGLVALVIAAAGWILYRELRAAGVLRRAGARSRRPSLQPATPNAAPTTLADLEPLPPGERVGALFRLVVAALDARGSGGAAARTHRQLRDTVQLADRTSSQQFAALAAVAEEQLYAPAPVETVRLEAALSDGVALYGAIAGRRAS